MTATNPSSFIASFSIATSPTVSPPLRPQALYHRGGVVRIRRLRGEHNEEVTCLGVMPETASSVPERSPRLAHAPPHVAAEA